MENKKGGIIVGVLFLMISILFFYGIYFVVNTELNEYNIYKDFCEERPTFCYCSLFECEFKTLWSSRDGFSEDTKELCKIVKELNDTKMAFKIGCEI